MSNAQSSSSLQMVGPHSGRAPKVGRSIGLVCVRTGDWSAVEPFGPRLLPLHLVSKLLALAAVGALGTQALDTLVFKEELAWGIGQYQKMSLN
ncbi:hypothetical protein PENSUB_12023 [Penicillium subrubescens]|uniref:Uncharacterized protein n=1 Tax=Penicillium subrubescens TaxID=1316194 RepID=A0A1Q5T0H4_9EURO|nr:hypothetical protein PENSUB_12023 [Penicillium subrubescens]